MSKWEELNVYLPPTVNPNENQKRSEHDLIFTYLGALDNTYEAIRSQILASAEMPDFDSVVARIQQDESRRTLMNPQAPTDTDNRAFRASLSSPNPTAKAKGPTANDWCDHCKRAGHKPDGCWIRHPHLRPRPRVERGGARRGGFGGVSQQMGIGLPKQNQRTEEKAPEASRPGASLNTEMECASGSSVASTTQLNHLLSQLNVLLQQQNTGFVSHNSIICSLNSNVNNPNLADFGKNTTSWIIDSGATDHMTWDQNKLQNIRSTVEPQHVLVANGNKVKIEGLGTAKLLTKGVHNILYLPAFNTNLLSISKITQDLNCKVIFSPNKVIFQDQESGKKIGEGFFKKRALLS
jgi:hypothetical protein